METPITFGTDGWRATLDTFTAPRIRIVAQAVADYLREVEGREDAVERSSTSPGSQARQDAVGTSSDELSLADAHEDGLAVGYDARETSRGFAEEVSRVLAANGFDVYLPERDCPTPVTAWNIVERDLAGAMVITASHNPPEYNGVKFIPSDGAPALPEVTDEIEARLAEPQALDDEDEWGTVHEVDFVGPYAEYALDFVDADLSEMTVVYDAMHGSGRGVTDDLLERAGAAVHRLRCDRDPEFGGTPPEPSAENLGTLVDTVRGKNADFGVANDGDADRLAVVTPERGFLDENLFFAAVYDYLLETREPGPAVRTVSTTFLIDRIAEAHGESVVETPVGFKWVAEAMAESDVLMGGEESGGFTIRGHLREKDGVLMALVAGALAAEESFDKRVDRLLDTHGEIHADKISIDCPDDEKSRVLADLEAVLPADVAGVGVERVNSADGFKILLADGSWLLVRPSGTEPVLRVYAEAGSEERVVTLLDAGRELVAPLV